MQYSAGIQAHKAISETHHYQEQCAFLNYSPNQDTESNISQWTQQVPPQQSLHPPSLSSHTATSSKSSPRRLEDSITASSLRFIIIPHPSQSNINVLFSQFHTCHYILVRENLRGLSIINMILILILTSFLGCIGRAFKCETPQRVGYMSYSTLLDYDHLTGLFEAIDKQIHSSECVNIQENQTKYSMKQIRPHIYYSDSKQNISYIDQYHANVTGGELVMVIDFEYEIVYSNSTTLTGVATTVNHLDNFWFSKSIINQKGKLIWKVSTMHELTLRTPIFITISHPKLPFDDKLEIEYILNGNNPECKGKVETIDQINTLYEQDLQKWLLSEPLMTSDNILYKFAFDKSINYMNHPYEFGLNERGLIYQFHFEVEDYTEECGNLSDNFESKFGGNQEMIAFGQLKASVIKGLEEGWFNVYLDHNWEIEQFQYYMGDLGNYMQKANKHIPIEPFEIKCMWDNSLYKIALQKNTDTRLYATIPYLCSFTVNNTQIQQLKLNVGLMITVQATSKSLVFTINPSTGVQNPKFTAMDGYEITSFQEATQCLKRIVASSIGTKTLGTGFPINERGRAGVFVGETYILIYDSSEPY